MRCSTRRSGGWPLTMFLTPEGAPFFGGTYFPKQGRYGLPGFVDLLPRVAAAYREQGDALAEQNRAARAGAREPRARGRRRRCRSTARPPPRWPSSSAPSTAVHGGFGGAPKFPHPSELALLPARAWPRAAMSER